jgi:hypothetical protein
MGRRKEGKEGKGREGDHFYPFGEVREGFKRLYLGNS